MMLLGPIDVGIVETGIVEVEVRVAMIPAVLWAVPEIILLVVSDLGGIAMVSVLRVVDWLPVIPLLLLVAEVVSYSCWYIVYCSGLYE
jgi:hypothetical protein